MVLICRSGTSCSRMRTFFQTASNDLHIAGVIARFFDPSEDPGDQPWMPCGMAAGSPDWCFRYGDRMPASVISMRHPELYSGKDSSGAGFVIHPDAARIYCAYAEE